MAGIGDLKKLVKDLDLDDKLDEVKDLLDADDDGDITDDVMEKVKKLKKHGVDVDDIIKKIKK